MLASYAQNSGITVFGKITDAATQKPIEYATISLKDSKGKIINGGVTDGKGNFKISNIEQGNYFIAVEFIGYKIYSDSLKVREAVKNMHLADIKLSAANETLNEVTVVSKTPLVENKIDKIVYNAANDVTAQGGVAIDLLKKVPQVSVDIDGNVELQGSSSIRFLINGKPSTVFGNNIADVLASIPASQIKSIEAITSPGAKYDAQGTGGIINIILKDSKVKGMNGSVSGSAGTRLENGSVNLTVRNNNFGLNAFFSGNAQLRSHTPNNYLRTAADGSKLLQDGYSEFQRNGYQSGLGFDWDINKLENLSGSFGYNNYSNSGQGLTAQEQLGNGSGIPSDVFSTRTSNSSSSTHSFEWSLAYKKKFKKKGEEISLQYDDSYGVPNSNYSQFQVYQGSTSPFTGSRSNNPGVNREAEIALDYTLPLGEDVELETGLKTAFQGIQSTADVFTLNPSSKQYALDPAQSYSFHYNRQIYAGYLSASYSLGKALDVKTGIRFEHTESTIDYPGTVIPPYNTFAPSVTLSHKFENGNTIKLAYTHRIERPDYREINPFYNLADPYNITTGNPTLKPELGNNFELGFNKIFENGGNLYVSLVSRFNSQDIKPYTTFYPTFKIGDSVYQNVSVATRVNIGLENRTGISISGSMPLTKGLNVRSNIFISNRHVVNKLLANAVTNGLDARINMNLTYEFNKSLVAEGFANYNPPSNNVQGRQPQFFAYTLAMRKFFNNKKASIGITATNPFSSYIRQETTVVNSGYTSANTRLVPYQSFGINFSYKFGKLEFKKAKEEDNNFIKNPDGGN